MARDWESVPISSELFENLPEVVLGRSLTAMENCYVNEAGGHSRFPGLALFGRLQDAEGTIAGTAAPTALIATDANAWNRGFRSHVVLTDSTEPRTVLAPETCGAGSIVRTSSGAAFFVTYVPGNWFSMIVTSGGILVGLGKDALSADKAIISEDRGETFTAYDTNAGTWQGLVEDTTNSLLVAVNSISSAVGAGQRIQTSGLAGTSWTYRTAPGDRRYNAIAHSPTLSSGILSAIGQIRGGATGVGAWANDPTGAWTAATMPTPTVTWQHNIAVERHARFLAVGRNGIAKSLDGKTYSFVTSYPDVGFQRIADSEVLDMQMAVSDDTSNGGIIAVSKDAGENWETVYSSSTVNFTGVSYNPAVGRWLITGLINAELRTFILTSVTGYDFQERLSATLL